MKLMISDKDMERMKEWFHIYVSTFKYGGEKLRQNTILKENHSRRVKNEILDIGKWLDLKENELRLAEVTALLHDIGRFEQYARYGTFVDAKTEDHAALGVKILERYGVLNCFNQSLKDLIVKIIGYHNRVKLPRQENETCLFFTRLLRDADKLDIYRVVTEYYNRDDGRRNGALELDLPDTPGISEGVYGDIIKGEIVQFEHVKNLNDFKVLQVGWIFDINFDLTLHHIVSRDYLGKIRHVLPDSEAIGKIFSVTDSYINKKFEK
jgi:putative nucleotidyltransferase with HDIG domain